MSPRLKAFLLLASFFVAASSIVAIYIGIGPAGSLKFQNIWVHLAGMIGFLLGGIGAGAAIWSPDKRPKV